MVRRAFKRKQLAFTLVESVIVMVVLGIAAVAIGGIAGNIFRGRESVSEAQVRTRMLTECLEQVLAVKRQDGYDELTNSGRFGTGSGGVYCDGLTAQTGTAPPSVSSSSYAGSACPAGAMCRLVTIDTGAAVTLMVVNY